MNANFKSTVSVRIPTGVDDVYRSELRAFSRVPAVGEYVCLGPRQPTYKVALVVHYAFDEAEYSAEIFTEPKGLPVHEVETRLRAGR